MASCKLISFLALVLSEHTDILAKSLNKNCNVYCVAVFVFCFIVFIKTCAYFETVFLLNFTPSLNTGITEITEYFTHQVDKAQDQNLSQGYKPMKNLRCTCTLINLQLLQSRCCMRKSPWRFPGTSLLNYLEPLQHLCKLEGFAWCTLKKKILHIRHLE